MSLRGIPEPKKQTEAYRQKGKKNDETERSKVNLTGVSVQNDGMENLGA
jgi:hypothetical protein